MTAVTTLRCKQDPLGQRSVFVPGFSRFGGRHCESSALQKVLAHAGISHSEEFIFGIGGGISFVYWLRADSFIPFVGGRNGRFPDFMVNMVRSLGHDAEIVGTTSPERAHKSLLAELGQCRPVICYGDIFFLPYFHVARNFGGHAFVVYGIDEHTGQVFVSDRGAQPYTISVADLKRARGSHTHVFPPKHSLVRLRLRANADITDEALVGALRSCCRAMLHPPIRNFGLQGIATFREHLTRSIAHLSPSDLCDLLVATYVNLELAGTGGCAFRKMYHDFLTEVVERPRFGGISEALPLLSQAIVHWERLVEALVPPAGPATIQLKLSLKAKERAFEQGGINADDTAEQCQRDIQALHADASRELAAYRSHLLQIAEVFRDIERFEANCFEMVERMVA